MPKKNHPKDKHYLQNAAEATNAALPDQHAFLIVCQETGKPAPAQYVSSMERVDAIKMLKTLLFQWGEEENWMKHIK